MLTGIIINEIIFTIILTLGITALAMEIFVPSFGLIGIAGIYLIFESILAIGNIDNAFIYILISIILSAILSIIMLKIFFRNIENNRLVLNSSLKDTTGSKLGKVTNDLVNKIGIVEKVLRPSGLIDIDGVKYSAVSNGDFITRGSNVVVEKIENSQLYVKKID